MDLNARPVARARPPRPTLGRREIRTWARAWAGALSLALTAGTALTAGAALLALVAPSAQAAEPAVKALPVAPDTWYVQGVPALGSAANRNFISNAGFVVTPEGVVVVDALGAPALAEELLAEIRQRTPLPVRWVLVTHCHADHLYGLQVFQAAGARILAHPACREYLHSDTARLRLQASRDELAPWVDEHTRLVTPDTWTEAAAPGQPEPDTVLRLGGHVFRIRHVGPAHTPEDLMVLDEATGVLFAGDLVFRGRIPFVGQADSGQWLQSLDRMLALKPRTLVPGHGPLSHTAAADLQLTRDYLAYLRQTMGEAARQMTPFDEAYASTDWSRFAGLPLFAVANRMNAYNTYLLMERQSP